MKHATDETLAALMAPLLDNPTFSVWMETVAGLADRALFECTQPQTVASERLTSSALAELGVYEDIFELWEGRHIDWRDDLEERPPISPYEQEARMREAMTILLHAPAFIALMDYFRKQRRATVKTALSTSRLQGLQALGTLNAYRDLIGIEQQHFQFMPHREAYAS